MSTVVLDMIFFASGQLKNSLKRRRKTNWTKCPRTKCSTSVTTAMYLSCHHLLTLATLHHNTRSCSVLSPFSEGLNKKKSSHQCIFFLQIKGPIHVPKISKMLVKCRETHSCKKIAPNTFLLAILVLFCQSWIHFHWILFWNKMSSY